jgi:hypothetical protein
MKTRRHIRHKKRQTRKQKQVAKQHKTIPELRKAFESIEAFARTKPSVKEFQARWQRIFGKSISAKAAEEYITFMSKKRHQKGGQAPLNYEMRPGEYTTPDGAYQAYVSKGFFVAEPANINCSASQKGGMQNPADTAAAFIGHPYTAQNPPSFAHIGAKMFIGQEVPITSDITKMNPNYQSIGAAIVPSVVTPLSNTPSSLMARA